MAEAPSGSSSIADGIIINGNIAGEGDMTLSGVIEGQVLLKNGTLKIEDVGYVEGDIQVKEISVAGEVRGTIEASSKVIIRPSGKIKGDVKTARIDIAEGAFLCGNFEVEDKLKTK